jgi:hypothetical protein
MITKSSAPAANTATPCSTGRDGRELFARPTATAIGITVSRTIRMSKTPPNDSQPVAATSATLPRPLSSPSNHGMNMQTSRTKPPAAASISPRLTREVSKSSCL